MDIIFIAFELWIASKLFDFGLRPVGSLLWLLGLHLYWDNPVNGFCYIGLSVALDYVIGIAIGLFILIWQSLFGDDDNNERIVRQDVQQEVY